MTTPHEDTAAVDKGIDDPPELRDRLDEVYEEEPQPFDPDESIRPEGDAPVQEVEVGGKTKIETTHPGGTDQTGDSGGGSLQEDQGTGSR